MGSIKVIRSGQVRRAKLYYLRDRKGKSARISEKIKKKIGVDTAGDPLKNETGKEDSEEENLIKNKDADTKTDLKKEKLKTEKK